MFSDAEIAYIKSQRLARIATVAPGNPQPDVAAVVYQFDGEFFYIGGFEQEKTLKFLNAKKNPKVAFVIDDLESVKPWKPRGLKLHGDADIVERKVEVGSNKFLRFRPRLKWSWGIDEDCFQNGKPVIRKTVLA